MAGSADVRAIEALDRMRAALKTFAPNVQEALASAERAVQETEGWIQERVEYWAQAVRRRVGEVEAAEMSLRACEADTDEDGYGRDCSFEESQLLLAKRRLEEAQHELETASQWQITIAKAVPKYRQEAQRMSRVSYDSVAGGSATLDEYATHLQSYASR